jgi:NADH-quinone oxidoreductase subunit G
MLSLPMIEFTIDGKVYKVPKGTTVYQAAMQAGVDIPIFCYQDRMPPFGACRVCLVEVENSSKLQASCTLEATEGMVVHTCSEKAIEGRKSILELLLINHPLDCPICDRGGECPLQENALHHGPGKSRFFETKRTFKKPLPLGPVLMLDRERCIVCARCTRFGELLAGDHALEMIDRGYKTEVGTPGSGPVESKFIGNTIMICPVGALTSQVYRFRARPWDNDATPSTCTLCPVGCSLFLDARDGEIVRTRSRENREVNDIWLCDKGWFGYEFSSHPDRLKRPLARRNGKLEPVSWEEAFHLMADQIIRSKPRGKLAAFGGAPLTLEENYLLQKLMREGANVPHVDHRVGDPLFSINEEGISPGMRLPIQELESLDYFCLLGLDLTEAMPVLWLRLRQAINKGAEGVFVGYGSPEIAPYLKEVMLHVPGKEETFILEAVEKAVQKAKEGKKGAIFLGSQYLSHQRREEFISLILKKSKEAPSLSINALEGRGGSLGARYAGMHPEFEPLGKITANPGKNTLQVIKEGVNEGWDFLYTVGVDPANRLSASHWINFRSNLRFLAVQDLFLTKTAQEADLVLPALSFVEKSGHALNIEGLLSLLSPGKEIPPGLLSESDIFRSIGNHLGTSLNFDPLFEQALQEKRWALADIPRTSASYEKKIAHEGQMCAIYEGKLFDQGVRMSHNPHLYQLSKTPFARMHPHEGKKRGISDRGKIHISHEANSVEGEVQFDPQVAENTIIIPLGFNQISAYELSDNPVHGFFVEVSPL